MSEIFHLATRSGTGISLYQRRFRFNKHPGYDVYEDKVKVSCKPTPVTGGTINGSLPPEMIPARSCEYYGVVPSLPPLVHVHNLKKPELVVRDSSIAQFLGVSSSQRKIPLYRSIGRRYWKCYVIPRGKRFFLKKKRERRWDKG